VLDASVGVKWFKDEQGSGRARALYLAVSVRRDRACRSDALRSRGARGRAAGDEARAIPEGWRHIKASGVAVLPLSDEVVAEAARQCEALGCSFYDALAPACASLLGATLASADERAHGAYPGVHLIPGPAS
jgi:predicted nucleic acid-binding protein